jgi:hypothetical protein
MGIRVDKRRETEVIILKPKVDIIDDPEIVYDFCAEIIKQAVQDWRDGRLDYKRLESFLLSGWGRLLCGKVDPMLIITRLEQERNIGNNNDK